LPVIIGMAALALGAIIYMTDRPAGSACFLHVQGGYLSFYTGGQKWFGAMGGNLPAFIHVFAFSLLSWSLMDNPLRNPAKICSFWFIVDAVFELGQKYPAIAVQWIPGWFCHVPLLKKTRAFFTGGTFDILDITAFAIGALTACACLMIVEKELRHEIL
jgi:hypothetical protein